MQAIQWLHKALATGLPGIHRRRLSSLLACVEGLLLGGGLWLTEVGRHLPGEAKEKHQIKRVDRLLGNVHLRSERPGMYRWLAATMLGQRRHPVVLVDWTDVDAAQTAFVLRAAVSMGGRALSVYEAVYRRCHRRRDVHAFLEQLAQVLPPGCQPVLVTDAGFRGPWFKAVEARGWFFVGRVRHTVHACRVGDERWFVAKTLYQQATRRAKALGELWFARRSPWCARAYVYRGKAAGRHRQTVHGNRRCGSASEKHAKGQREPWLLVSNLPERRGIAKHVVDIYRQRMGIEEAFRDLKATRHGFAFRHNLGRRPERIEVLLLIAALATLMIWMVGLAACRRGLDRELQANTERRRRVLSVFFVGRRVLARGRLRCPDDYPSALKHLRHAVVDENLDE